MLLYREFAEHYFSLERSAEGLHTDTAALESALRARNVERVVDVGCGSGEYVAALAGRGFLIHGLDRSSHMIRTAQERFPELADSFAVGHWDHMEGSAPFDALLCLFGSLGYCLTDRRVLRSFRSFRGVLRSDGVAVLEVWQAEPLALALRASAGKEGAESLSAREAGGELPFRRRKHWAVIRERPFVVRLDYVYETPRGPRLDRHFLRAFRPEEIRALAAAAGFSMECLTDSFALTPGSLDARTIRMVTLLRAV